MEPPSSPRVVVLNQFDDACLVGWAGVELAGVDMAGLEFAVTTAFRQNGCPYGEANLLLTSDFEIADLNKRFRGIDEATDVLSFPSGESLFLGDIAISVPYAARQARARGVELHEELAFLAIHGALHLLGWNDETENERARMVDEMNRIAALCSLRTDFEWASLLHAEAQ